MLGINVGMSKKLINEAKGFINQEIGRLKEGINWHRIIVGPKLVQTYWYPTLVLDDKTKKLVQSMRTVVRPSEGCILDNIASFDENITRQYMRESNQFSEEDIKKYKSALRPSKTYRFLVFDRDADGGGAPTVRVYDYPWSVLDGLDKLQNAVNPKNSQFLLNGLIFMFDVYITKTIDSSKTAQYGTDYSLQPVPETLPSLLLNKKIPTAWLEWDESKGECPFDMSDYFTEEELQAISDYELDIDTVAKSNTIEEIEDKLSKFPIYLKGVFLFGDKKNQPMFPSLLEQDVQDVLFKDYSKYLSEGGTKEEEIKKSEQSEKLNVSQTKEKTMSGSQLRSRLGLSTRNTDIVEEAQIVTNKEEQPEEVSSVKSNRPEIKIGNGMIKKPSVIISRRK